MIYRLDRIEGEYAVLEGPDREMIQISAGLLPAGVREGSALKQEDGLWTLSPEDDGRTARIRKKMDALWK